MSSGFKFMLHSEDTYRIFSEVRLDESIICLPKGCHGAGWKGKPVSKRLSYY